MNYDDFDMTPIGRRKCTFPADVKTPKVKKLSDDSTRDRRRKTRVKKIGVPEHKHYPDVKPEQLEAGQCDGSVVVDATGVKCEPSTTPPGVNNSSHSVSVDTSSTATTGRQYDTTRYNLRRSTDMPSPVCYVSPLYNEMKTRSATSRYTFDHPLVIRSPPSLVDSTATSTPLNYNTTPATEPLHRRESYLSNSSSGFVSSPESESNNNSSINESYTTYSL